MHLTKMIKLSMTSGRSTQDIFVKFSPDFGVAHGVCWWWCWLWLVWQSERLGNKCPRAYLGVLGILIQTSPRHSLPFSFQSSSLSSWSGIARLLDDNFETTWIFLYNFVATVRQRWDNFKTTMGNFLRQILATFRQLGATWWLLSDYKRCLPCGQHLAILTKYHTSAFIFANSSSAEKQELIVVI